MRSTVKESIARSRRSLQPSDDSGSTDSGIQNSGRRQWRSDMSDHSDSEPTGKPLHNSFMNGSKSNGTEDSRTYSQPNLRQPATSAAPAIFVNGRVTTGSQPSSAPHDVPGTSGIANGSLTTGQSDGTAQSSLASSRPAPAKPPRLLSGTRTVRSTAPAGAATNATLGSSSNLSLLNGLNSVTRFSLPPIDWVARDSRSATEDETSLFGDPLSEGLPINGHCRFNLNDSEVEMSCDEPGNVGKVGNSDFSRDSDSDHHRMAAGGCCCSRCDPRCERCLSAIKFCNCDTIKKAIFGRRTSSCPTIDQMDNSKSDDLDEEPDLPETEEKPKKHSLKGVATAIRASTSLAQISVKRQRDLRQNSGGFLQGASGNAFFVNLVGMEKLKALYPDKTVTVFVGTWNMAECKPTVETLHHWLLPSGAETMPDIFMIGVQEGALTRPWLDWEISLQQTIGFDHFLFERSYLAAQHLSIFIRKELAWYMSKPECQSVNTRMVNKLRTKGAVRIKFHVFGTSFVAISCHLPFADSNARFADADYILDYLLTSDQQESSPDVIFWLGDFNFRLKNAGKLTSTEVIRMKWDLQGETAQKAAEKMLLSDELLLMHEKGVLPQAGTSFVKFTEQPIEFLPTYKYDIGTNIFDTSAKKRVPAFTDRILYRAKRPEKLIPVSYDSVPEITDSDHKPVYAIYNVELRPGKDGTPLFADKFLGIVHEKAKRAEASTNPVNARQRRKLDVKHKSKVKQSANRSPRQQAPSHARSQSVPTRNQSSVCVIS